MDDTYTIGWVDKDGDFRYLDVRGIQDLSEFIRNSDAHGRRITTVKNKTWEAE